MPTLIVMLAQPLAAGVPELLSVICTEYVVVTDMTPVSYGFVVVGGGAVMASGAVTMSGSYKPWMPAAAEIQPKSYVKSIVHFLTYPEKPVEQVIEAALIFLNDIVTEAENKFGIPKR